MPACFLEELIILDTLGTTISAITPKITITANTSTKVNPLFFILSPYLKYVIVASVAPHGLPVILPLVLSIDIVFNSVLLENAFVPIDVTLLGMVILVKPSSAKDCALKVVTVEGTVTVPPVWA